MPFIGNKPSAVPLTSADIADGIITSAKITDATIVNGDIANATIALAKLSATGTASSTTFLRGDNTWGSAGAAAGQVIQVVNATDTTERNYTSSSFVTASNTLSASITPSSSSNKIFIIITCGVHEPEGIEDGAYTIYKNGSTNLGTATYGLGRVRMAGGANGYPMTLTFLDSPSTTSSTTYQLYVKSNGSQELSLNWSGSRGSITLMEVKG